MRPIFEKGALRGSLLAALLLLPAVGQGAFRDPLYQRGLLFLPYKFHIGYEADAFLETMYSQGYTVVSWKNETGGPEIPDCGIDKFAWEIEHGFHGMILVDTHSNDTDGAFEAYRDSTARGAAWNQHLSEGWSPYELTLGRSEGGYDIGIVPSALDDRFSGGHDEIVLISACDSWMWMEDAFSDARCTVGYRDDCSEHSQVDRFLRRLNGEEGVDRRDVLSAIEGLGGGFDYRGNGGTVLAPTVIDISPLPGSVIDEATDGWVEFDTEMDTSLLPAQTTGKAQLRDQHWEGSDRLSYVIDPYWDGDFDIQIHDALSAGGSALDGNQDPPGTNGHGPSGDPFCYPLSISGVGAPIWAASFEGAWAYPAEGGTRVMWTAERERGSIRYDVYGGRDRATLLASVPASGTSEGDRFYETVVAPGNQSFEVVERDGDPATACSTRPFGLSASPPANLGALLRLNGALSTPGALRQGGAQRIAATRIPATGSGSAAQETPAVVTDFVYYSSDWDFLAATQPVRDWWAERGFTSQVVFGPADPEACRNAIRAVWEAAGGAEAASLPFLVIVGEANEGSEPQKNIVGTFYPEDEDGECYWGCASDALIVDFDGDGLPDVPWTRLPVCALAELEHMVETTLDYCSGAGSPAPRALILDGDRSGLCEPTPEPRATLLDIESWYEAAGIPATLLHDSDLDCGDYAGRLALASAQIDAGITEMLGIGWTTSRSILPGFFLQKVYDPPFEVGCLQTRQRIVAEFPGCGMGDTDRDNPGFYPSIAKMFLTADPETGPSAAAWLGHLRGGVEPLHLELARRYFQKRFETGAWCVQETYFRAVREMGELDPGAAAFLRLAGAYGFPVGLPDMLAPSAVDDVVQTSWGCLKRCGTDMDCLRRCNSKQAAVEFSVRPQPISSEAEIAYRLPVASRVELRIHDVAGRLVRNLIPDRLEEAGEHRIAWDGRDDRGRRLPAGVYYAALRAGVAGTTKKLVILE